MIRVIYSELDGPEGLTLRLEASGHAGYAPAGQDIVCAGASTLMQALVSLLAGEKTARSDAWDEPEGPRLAVTAAAPQEPWVEGAFELAKAGFALLAERYPDNLRFADLSRRGEAAMMDLQLFAEGGGETGGAGSAPALSEAQARQAVASGTLKPGREEAAPPETPKEELPKTNPGPEAPCPGPEPPRPPLPEHLPGRQAVAALHSRWAAEEAAMRDAYRLAHYEDALRQTAHAVEQGVVERIRQRASRPAENGTRPGSAAVTGADVSRMTRAQREALERKALHGEVITF